MGEITRIDGTESPSEGHEVIPHQADLIEVTNGILMDTRSELPAKASFSMPIAQLATLGAGVLKGIGSASNAVGRLIGSIPKIKDGQVDEFLQDSGERLKNNAVGMERNVVKAFAEISNPGTGVFTEKMRDLILIYNHTAEICFDDKQIYLIAE